jgi:hypothetical protein
VFYHCTAWFWMSAIRFVYIFHNDPVHKLVPGHGRQCWIALTLQVSQLPLTLVRSKELQANFNLLQPNLWWNVSMTTSKITDGWQ